MEEQVKRYIIWKLLPSLSDPGFFSLGSKTKSPKAMHIGHGPLDFQRTGNPENSTSSSGKNVIRPKIISREEVFKPDQGIPTSPFQTLRTSFCPCLLPLLLLIQSQIKATCTRKQQGFDHGLLYISRQCLIHLAFPQNHSANGSLC